MDAPDVYRMVDPSPFLDAVPRGSIPAMGSMPELRWIPIGRLRISRAYQREIGRRGGKNVRRIIAEFDWLKFGTVIVAPLGDGTYAIVDGQHRCTGAAALRIQAVPCMVIFADARQQAGAFAAINGSLTLMTPMQIHHANLASGDTRANALHDACAAAGVTIRTNVTARGSLRVGDTLAVTSLARLLDLYGAPTLTLALRCITRTRDGNPGLVRASVVKALCGVLAAEPSLLSDEEGLLALVSGIDLVHEHDEAWVESRNARTRVDVALLARLLRRIDAGVAAGKGDGIDLPSALSRAA